MRPSWKSPLDAGTVAFMGILMAYTGDWERGCALAERAMQLNPLHRGWYRFAAFNRLFRKSRSPVERLHNEFRVSVWI